MGIIVRWSPVFHVKHWACWYGETGRGGPVVSRGTELTGWVMCFTWNISMAQSLFHSGFGPGAYRSNGLVLSGVLAWLTMGRCFTNLACLWGLAFVTRWAWFGFGFGFGSGFGFGIGLVDLAGLGSVGVRRGRNSHDVPVVRSGAQGAGHHVARFVRRPLQVHLPSDGPNGSPPYSFRLFVPPTGHRGSFAATGLAAVCIHGRWLAWIGRSGPIWLGSATDIGLYPSGGLLMPPVFGSLISQGCLALGPT